ncbi:hypothetical protein F4777DRAFT_259984 [Nemania sp. FL0916]|nr:hypothetical protein F4777DRAFT_259984 [Nemania sp. FL0916]
MREKMDWELVGVMAKKEKGIGRLRGIGEIVLPIGSGADAWIHFWIHFVRGSSIGRGTVLWCMCMCICRLCDILLNVAALGKLVLTYN